MNPANRIESTGCIVVSSWFDVAILSLFRFEFHSGTRRDAKCIPQATVNPGSAFRQKIDSFIVSA